MYYIQHDQLLYLFLYFLCTEGSPECSANVNTTAVTDTSVTVIWAWISCKGVEPSSISLTWPAEHDISIVRDNIPNIPANYKITDLLSSTNYSIMLRANDACGSISAETVGVTLASASEYKCHACHA